jgi:hypothetical protein
MIATAVPVVIPGKWDTPGCPASPGSRPSTGAIGGATRPGAGGAGERRGDKV